MKTLLTIAFLAFVTLTTSAVGIQPSSTEKTTRLSSFKFFRIHRQGNGVVLSWAPASTQVQHFQIERSYDGEFFEPVNTVACNGQSTHKYMDEAVFSGYIHYRIVAVNGDTSSDISPVEVIRIVQRK